MVPSIINVSSPVPRLLPTKEIFWPTMMGFGDSSKFPSLTAIKARRGAESADALEAFTKAVNEAQDRVFILDDYLFKPDEGAHQEPRAARQRRVREILGWFPADFEASDVRILTSSIGDAAAENDIVRQFGERAASINRPRVYPGQLQIGLSFALGSQFPYVHDRFAVIDDELWHFGATVGGFHRKVNAATRGWSAAEHQACDFFEIAWRGDDDLGRYHDKVVGKR